MNTLYSASAVKNLLSRYNIRPKKRLGQTFLFDRNIVQKLIAASTIQPEDVVMEIGTGTGTITQELARRARRVITFEIDDRFADLARKTLSEYQNVEVIHADILKTDIASFALQYPNFKVVANLPYSAAAPIIRAFLELPRPPGIMALIVQKEVAEKICAKPPRMNLLALAVQFYATPHIIAPVSKNSFYPKPRVNSCIVTINLRHQKVTIHKDTFFRIVRAGFLHPRKHLASNLSEGLQLPRTQVVDWLQRQGISPSQRAQTLSPSNWLALARSADL